MSSIDVGCDINSSGALRFEGLVDTADVELMDVPYDQVAKKLPWPDRYANKYSRGKLIIVGGSSEYPGAMVLAGCAGERMGAGYVEEFASQDALFAIHAQCPTIVAKPYPVSDEFEEILHAGKSPKACLLGSGIEASRDFEKSLCKQVLSSCDIPLVVDGGAISVLSEPSEPALAKQISRRIGRGLETVMTPHLGEAARLAHSVGLSVPQAASAANGLIKMNQEDIDKGLSSYAYKLSLAYRSCIVLKGPVTYICDAYKTKSATVWAMRLGTSALAKAGTGDVLAGMVASLLAQGLTALDASMLATLLHAQAARLASSKLTDICVCASDVINYLPEAIKEIRP